MKFDNEYNQYSIGAVVLGSLGLVSWLLPMVSVLLGVVGVYLAYKGQVSPLVRVNQLGLTLSCLALVLTLLRSGLVYYFG